MTEREQVPDALGRGTQDDTMVQSPPFWQEHTTPDGSPLGGPVAAAPPADHYPADQYPVDHYPADGYPADGYVDEQYVPAGYASAAVAGHPPAGPAAWNEDWEDHDFPDDGWEGVEREPAIRSAEYVALPRAEAFGSLLLILAGIAAGVSLLLPWVRDSAATGWTLAGHGLVELRTGVGQLGASGYWQPLAVVLGGGLLFVLGLLLVVPARTHRLLGVLALFVALAAGAGVLVPLATAGWNLHRFDVGIWFAVAVAGLGLLGALKALLTGPRFSRG